MTSLAQKRWLIEQRQAFDRARQAPVRQRQRERVAFHEAAHAALAHMAEMSVVRVELAPVARLLTRRSHADLAGDLGMVPVVAMLYAGHVAERRRFGDYQLAADDFRDIEPLVAGLPERRRSTTYTQALDLAYRLVERCWPGIEAVAAALMERGNLDVDALERLLGPASRCEGISVRGYAPQPARPGTAYQVIGTDGVELGEVKLASDGQFEAWAGGRCIGRFGSLPAAARAV